MFYIKIDEIRFPDASISVLKTFYLSKTFLNYSRLVINKLITARSPLAFFVCAPTNIIKNRQLP